MVGSNLTVQFKGLTKEFRVKDWYHYLGFTLLGYFFTTSFPHFFELLISLLLSSLLLAYTYSMDDYFDNKTKRKLFLIPLLFIFLVTPLLSTLQIVSSLIFIFLFSAYSIKLKKIPFLCTLSNAIGFPILFLIGANGLSYKHTFFFILLFLVGLVAQLIHEIVHMKGDKRAKRITTPIFLGRENTEKLLKCILLLTSLYAFLLGIKLKMITLPLTALNTSVFTIYMRNRKIDEEIRTNYRKVGVLSGFLILLEEILQYLINII